MNKRPESSSTSSTDPANPSGIDSTTESWFDVMRGRYYRIAASGLIPARWYEAHVPRVESRQAREGRLHLEIVSHCWQYSRFLRYQLSSLANFAPSSALSSTHASLDVTMTVCFSEEDKDTWRLLQAFSEIEVPNVSWNWCNMPKQQLFRRAIGRNRAALQSDADWLWFTDCDLMFRAGCLDALAAALQGRRDVLLFPASEWCTPLLDDDDPLLNPAVGEDPVIDIDTSLFTERKRSRATGPLQITHGDVARACGYCNALPYYQRPASAWCKAYEDRAFRWLLRSQGTPIAIPGVYRIRHASKGRYTGNPLVTTLRGWLRRVVSRFQERRLR